jgi:hypothetical protein
MDSEGTRILAVPQLSWLVADFAPQRRGFQPGSGNRGFVVEKNDIRVSVIRVLQFPLPIRIPPVAPQSTSSIIWG